MKEISFKAGVIGGVFTFLVLFATTSKASINEPAATNGDYKINRVQWLLEHPNQEWNNYLIYLYADLDKWKVRLDLVNKDYSSFHEPDLNNQLTAIALQDDGRMFKKLKLVRE